MTKITVVPDPQREGCEVEIRITGAGAGSTVTVSATNANGGNESIDLTVDSSGNGSLRWQIPAGWAGSYTADFDSPGATGDTIKVHAPDGDCYPIPEDSEE